MVVCVVCEGRPKDPVGTLCPACASAIAGAGQRAPGIVTSKHPPDQASAWLVDEWGQPHALGARCRIGRDNKDNDLVIADLIVSSEHAELRRDGGSWSVRDRGSANGTRVGDAKSAREARLAHCDRVWFGAVGFYFWAESEVPARNVAPPRVRTIVPEPATYRLAAPNQGELTVRAANGHLIERAPGEWEYRPPRGRVVRGALGRLQFQLLRRLCEAALTADEGTAPSRSVGTHELLGTLPFQTSNPEPNHVRQVVSNLRSALERGGVPDAASADGRGLVEANEGLGYRLTWSVSRLGRE